MEAEYIHIIIEPSPEKETSAGKQPEFKSPTQNKSEEALEESEDFTIDDKEYVTPNSYMCKPIKCSIKASPKPPKIKKTNAQKMREYRQRKILKELQESINNKGIMEDVSEFKRPQEQTVAIESNAEHTCKFIELHHSCKTKKSNAQKMREYRQRKKLRMLGLLPPKIQKTKAERAREYYQRKKLKEQWQSAVNNGSVEHGACEACLIQKATEEKCKVQESSQPEKRHEHTNGKKLKKILQETGQLNEPKLPKRKKTREERNARMRNYRLRKKLENKYPTITKEEINKYIQYYNSQPRKPKKTNAEKMRDYRQRQKLRLMQLQPPKANKTKAEKQRDYRRRRRLQLTSEQLTELRKENAEKMRQYKAHKIMKVSTCQMSAVENNRDICLPEPSVTKVDKMEMIRQIPIVKDMTRETISDYENTNQPLMNKINTAAKTTCEESTEQQHFTVVEDVVFIIDDNVIKHSNVICEYVVPTEQCSVTESCSEQICDDQLSTEQQQSPCELFISDNCKDAHNVYEQPNDLQQAPKPRKSNAEIMRDYRERKKLRMLGLLPPKIKKTSAERMREYRQRKKLRLQQSAAVNYNITQMCERPQSKELQQSACQLHTTEDGSDEYQQHILKPKKSNAQKMREYRQRKKLRMLGLLPPKVKKSRAEQMREYRQRKKLEKIQESLNMIKEEELYENNCSTSAVDDKYEEDLVCEYEQLPELRLNSCEHMTFKKFKVEVDICIPEEPQEVLQIYDLETCRNQLLTCEKGTESIIKYEEAEDLKQNDLLRLKPKKSAAEKMREYRQRKKLQMLGQSTLSTKKVTAGRKQKIQQRLNKKELIENACKYTQQSSCLPTNCVIDKSNAGELCPVEEQKDVHQSSCLLSLIESCGVREYKQSGETQNKEAHKDGVKVEQSEVVQDNCQTSPNKSKAEKMREYRQKRKLQQTSKAVKSNENKVHQNNCKPLKPKKSKAEQMREYRQRRNSRTVCRYLRQIETQFNTWHLSKKQTKERQRSRQRKSVEESPRIKTKKTNAEKMRAYRMRQKIQEGLALVYMRVNRKLDNREMKDVCECGIPWLKHDLTNTGKLLYKILRIEFSDEPVAQSEVGSVTNQTSIVFASFICYYI